MTVEEYTCHYLTDATHSARAIYHARTLAEAMAAHNAALPQHAEKVLKWVGPSGISYHMHDTCMTLDGE